MTTDSDKTTARRLAENARQRVTFVNTRATRDPEQAIKDLAESVRLLADAIDKLATRDQ